MPVPANKQWQCRMAPSLGALEDDHKNVWGTADYWDPEIPTVFFGLYGFPDFYTLWKHKGRKAILWAGSDIKHFTDGYWLDESGSIRLDPEPLARWINANCESYVENGVEHELLIQYGIESKIVPSFLGQVKDYQISYTPNERPQVYASVSGDNFAMYGWEQIELIADKCNVDFHLYGNVAPWITKHSNVFVHGRIPKKQMNEEIRHMQGGLRLNEFDGFSEILAKSVLWGQHPISRVGYSFVESFENNDHLIMLLNHLKTRTAPDTEARDYLLSIVNKYPWTHAQNN